MRGAASDQAPNFRATILNGAGAVVLASLVAACLPSLSSPDRLYPVSTEIAAIHDQVVMPDFAYYSQLIDAQKVSYRNAILDARMYAVDLEYYVHEADLTHERQEADFLASAANIGLTGTSVLVPAVQTKNILTGVAGGITGINSTYNDKVLLSKTIQVLQNQMRAERARVAAKIYAGMKLSATDYTLGMALSDLETYYRAGTVPGALIDISNTVSVEAVKAKEQKDSYVISYGVASEDAAVVLRAYVYPNGKVDAAHYANIKALLPSTVTAPLSRVLYLPEFSAVRSQLVQLARARGYIK